MDRLNLTIKRKWFEMIAYGRKTEEYREIKPYWLVRLFNFGEETDQQVIDEIICDMRDSNRPHHSLQEMYDYFNITPKRFDYVVFRNGYMTNSPVHSFPFHGLSIGKGNVEWGAPENQQLFIIKLAPQSARRDQ